MIDVKYPRCAKLNLFIPTSDPLRVSPGRLKISIGDDLFLRFCAFMMKMGYTTYPEEGIYPSDAERFLNAYRNFTPIKELLDGTYPPYPHMGN